MTSRFAPSEAGHGPDNAQDGEEEEEDHRPMSPEIIDGGHHSSDLLSYLDRFLPPLSPTLQGPPLLRLPGWGA